jgi:biopolymer transport protein ExbD
MNPFHSPFGLRERVKRPDTHTDALPLIGAVLLAILLGLAGSRFIFAPGLTVDLAAVTNSAEAAAPAKLELPRSPVKLQGVPTDATLTVPAPRPVLLTAHSDTMVFFEGRMFPQKDSSLRAAMADAVQKSKSATPTLLVRMDGSVTMRRFFQLKSYAEEAGFVKIQIAGEDNRSAPKSGDEKR